VKPSYAATTISSGDVETIVKGCDSVALTPGIQMNTWDPGTAKGRPFFIVIRVPP
jgi:hypothetical protein